jgi:hypothetical protein
LALSKYTRKLHALQASAAHHLCGQFDAQKGCSILFALIYTTFNANQHAANHQLLRTYIVPLCLWHI